MLGLTELPLFDVPPGSQSHRNLQEGLAVSKRAKELVRQILAFSRALMGA